MVGEDLVVINGQLCSKDVAAMLISKVLPTVLDVIAEKVKAGRPDKEVEEAAKNSCSCRYRSNYFEEPSFAQALSESALFLASRSLSSDKNSFSAFSISEKNS
ncbi:Uncharacterised protein [Escherichia coli]|uniref:Uncharacterized protein n=1 Tax=Escherichia coli TaxID=562 RepID=A0A377A317_ECOLX|nr:Uncharacterised protein [Escherichia coli]